MPYPAPRDSNWFDLRDMMLTIVMYILQIIDTGLAVLQIL